MPDPRTSVKPDQLYETDFAVWAETTAQLLREKRFAEIDLDNLIEAVEALSRSDKRELRSRLIKLLSHLLYKNNFLAKPPDSHLTNISDFQSAIAGN